MGTGGGRGERRGGVVFDQTPLPAFNVHNKKT